MPARCLIGVQLPEVEYEAPFPEVLAMARAAEEAGLDSVWVGDHLLYDLPGVGPRGPWEAWTTLAAIAAVTRRVRLGPLVASTGFHAPAMLAKLATTVDAASGGRLIVGLGAGWNQREYDAYGFPFDHRVSRFEEAFTIIRTLLRDGRCTFNGRYHSVRDCVLHPRSPRPGGPPLLLGSVGRRMLHVGLPHVDAWNVWWSDVANSPERFGETWADVQDVVRRLGRDPAQITATAAVYVQLPGGQGRSMGDYASMAGIEPLRGTVDELADQLSAFAAAGAGHLQLVVDPINRSAIETLGEVRKALDA